MKSLRMRRFIGLFERLFYLGYSTCKRCHRPWATVEPRSVYYDNGSGCFALCEQCWKETTKEERVAYYTGLVVEWRKFDKKDNGKSWSETNNKIQNAVINESED